MLRFSRADLCFVYIYIYEFFLINREKSKLKEEIIARRQKKLLVRRARQKYLEEAAVREAELLQQLDRFHLRSFPHLMFLISWI